ncbi:MAG: hypothetical protein EBU90_07460 [Proteobacteria bacterium]|nr:hypothetical protein [Pseudomonadota bacterium]NBP13459.1 hypothetical protein [bacterium]
MAFNKNGYELVKKVLSKDLLGHLSAQFQLQADIFNSLHNLNATDFGSRDNQVKNSFSWYGSFWSETLLLNLKNTVETVVEKNLYPTYSYARIYYTGAELVEHVDRPECEYSVTATLKVVGEDWPIYFKKPKNKISKIIILPGDILVYKGIELPHWREKLTEKTELVYQVFLHYVDSNGLYKDNKYDKRLGIGMPKML